MPAEQAYLREAVARIRVALAELTSAADAVAEHGDGDDERWLSALIFREMVHEFTGRATTAAEALSAGEQAPFPEAPPASLEARADLQRLAAEAIAGPWGIVTDSCDCGDGYGCPHGTWVHALRLPVPHTEPTGDAALDDYKHQYSELSEFPVPTVEFIAAARDALPALLDALDAAEADAARLRRTARATAGHAP